MNCDANISTMLLQREHLRNESNEAGTVLYGVGVRCNVSIAKSQLFISEYWNGEKWKPSYRADGTTI